jgi:DNA-binding phage protein
MPPTPKDRLKHLLELAAAPDTRAALKDELEVLLADWPEEYPQSSRAPFVMLLEKVTQETAHDEDSERAIVAALRGDDRDRVIAVLARAAGAGEEMVWHALSEESGEELAALCRDAEFSRATFSSLVLLIGPARGRPGEDVARMLQVYDAAQEALAAE